MQLKDVGKRLEDFRLMCKKHNLKITPQRIAIYKELLHSRNHPSADEVFQALKGDFSNISYDTVNRTLLSLAEIGVIDVVKSLGGARRFDPNPENHHHLHCIKCGKIMDFYSEECDRLKIPEEIQNQFVVLSKRVVLNGVCKECRQQRKTLEHKSQSNQNN